MHTPKVIVHRLRMPAEPPRAWAAPLLRAAAALTACAAVLTSIATL